MTSNKCTTCGCFSFFQIATSRCTVCSMLPNRPTRLRFRNDLFRIFTAYSVSLSSLSVHRYTFPNAPSPSSS